MKTYLLILVLLITGCRFPEPKYEIGDTVIVNGRITGIVVDTRTWSNQTVDHKVMIDGVAIWYDEEIIRPYTE